MRENLDENAPNFTSNLPVPALKLLDCSLRVSVIPLSIATIWLTVTNKQDNISYGKIEFSNFMGLKQEPHSSSFSFSWTLICLPNSSVFKFNI